MILAQSCISIGVYLNGNKTHERNAAGWEVATPYVDEHEDKGASKDAKVEEWEQAGNLAAEQCLSNLKSRTDRHVFDMHIGEIWQKQQEICTKQMPGCLQAMYRQNGNQGAVCKQHTSRKTTKGHGLVLTAMQHMPNSSM